MLTTAVARVVLVWLCAGLVHGLLLAVVPPAPDGSYLDPTTDYVTMLTCERWLVVKHLVSATAAGVVFALGLPWRPWRHIAVYVLIFAAMGLMFMLTGEPEEPAGPLLGLGAPSLIATLYGGVGGAAMCEAVRRARTKS